MSEPLALGIDIGTSSSKGVLVRGDGKIVARAVRPHEMRTPRPGWFEHDADGVWNADFDALAGQLLAAQPGAHIATVGVSGIGPCLLPADEAGVPLRPAILYGIDTRASEQIAQLDALLGPDEIRRSAGASLTSQAVGPKLLWLRQREPEVYERTKRLFMASSYLVHTLTGRYVLDHHSASQCTPMYNIAAHQWNEQWCELIAPGLQLPELVWPTELVGTVTAAAAERTGIPAGTPVTAGTIDAWAESVSVGVHDSGDVMVMYGTTMFLIGEVDRLTSHPGVWATAGVRPGSYSIAATLPTSGALTGWLSGITSADFPTLLAEADRAGPGANGLLLLPHFAGERTPDFDPNMRGMIAGLTLAHTRGDLYRAILEGIGLGVRQLLAALAEAAPLDAPRLVAVGGGTQGGLWTQVVSDVTGMPQELPAETIGACLGDAMLAASAVGMTEDASAWNPIQSVIAPDPGTTQMYDELFDAYLSLAVQTRNVAHRLAASQERRESPL